MKALLVAALCLGFSAPIFAQTSATEPASKDDVILYLRTMHSHDMMRRVLEVQSQTVQKLMREQILHDKGSLPADYDTMMAKMMDDLVKNMPVDEITQAMIPAYQKHFTKSDIEAMNAFYSSPVGQKVLEELPAVMQEGSEAAMPIASAYLSQWTEHLQDAIKKMGKADSKGALPSEAKP